MMGADKPNVSVDMRHSKLKREEAELLAGELTKPSWQSRNEGIHERVSFEDSIWGFDLAGGAYYQTPLRVVGVKPGSRAEKAGIRPGDRLKRINDIDTSTLTIQEAHEIIIQSGIHLKLAVTAPEDEEDAYFCYEDPLEVPYEDEEAERRAEEERARKRQVHAKVSSYWSLQWPWVSKRKIIYRESNCFMVPSKYESKHSDRFSPQPAIRTQEDIVLDSIKSKAEEINSKIRNPNIDKENIPNGTPFKDNHLTTNGVPDKNLLNISSKGIKQNGVNPLGEIPEEDSFQEDLDEKSSDEVSSLVDESHNELLSPSDGMLNSNDMLTPSEKMIDSNDMLTPSEKMLDSNEVSNDEEIKHSTNNALTSNEEMMNGNANDVNISHSEVAMNLTDDEIINKIAENGDNATDDEVLDSILSDEKSIEESGSMHER